MAEKHKGTDHPTETPDVSHIRNVEVKHETSDISVRAVLTFGAALTISMIAVCVGVWLLFNFFSAQEAKEPGPGPMALQQNERLPPEPRLQAAPGFEVTLESGQKMKLEKAAPQSEYQALRRQWEEKLQTINAAIDKVVSEGLPTKEPAKKLDDYVIKMPTAASSGRELEK
jgi:hypothetical protein